MARLEPQKASRLVFTGCYLEIWLFGNWGHIGRDRRICSKSPVTFGIGKFQPKFHLVPFDLQVGFRDVVSR